MKAAARGYSDYHAAGACRLRPDEALPAVSGRESTAGGALASRFCRLLVSLALASGSLTMELSVRGLLAHSESDYEEWGVSGSVRLDPGADGRGISVRLGSARGASSGGAERLWSQAHGAFSAGNFDPDARLDAEVAYGLETMRGLLTPYTGVALSEGGESWRAGARFRLGPSLDLELEASLKESAGDEKPESGVLLRGSKRW